MSRLSVRLKVWRQALLVAAIVLPGVGLAQSAGSDAYLEDYEDSSQFDEFGLPLITQTEYERQATAADQGTADSSGWGATPATEPGADAGWGATPGGGSSWGGQVIDRTVAGSTLNPCEITDDQFDLALQQADLALAEGNIDRWLDVILPLAKAGCDRPELYQRIAQAKQSAATSNQRRDQLIANATQQSRSRLRRPGEAPPPRSSSSVDWIGVANELANLGASVRAAREGRPMPPPTTIISQNADGSIAYSLPPAPPPAQPDPAVARELERRVAARRQMEQTAVQATNIKSWYKLREADPYAGVDDVEFADPGDVVHAGEIDYGASELGGQTGATPWNRATEQHCSAQNQPAGTQCMCQQGLYGLPSACQWRMLDGEPRENPCRVLFAEKCVAFDLGATGDVSCVGNGFEPHTVIWVVEVPRYGASLGAFQYAACASNGRQPLKASDVPGIDNDWRLSISRIVSSHRGTNQSRDAAKSLAASVAQCNENVRRKAESIHGTDLSGCKM